LADNCKSKNLWRQNGCPKCYQNQRGNILRKALLEKSGSLKDTYPNIAKDWHPTKNGDLKSQNLAAGSNVKIWWQCKKKHVWKTMIETRTLQGSGCPYCKGKKVSKDNNLAVLCPEIAKEWHPTKNGNLTPEDVTRGSDKKVWWKCKKKHEWDTTIKHRTRGTGCPNCRKEKLDQTR